MEKSEIMAKVSALGARVLQGLGMELVDVNLERQRSGWFLRYFIDRPGGVTLDDCQEASRQLGAELDVEDLIQGRYTLEVSSPGLDRPLRTEEDYHRFLGRLVVLHTFEPVERRRHFVGRLQSYEGGIVVIEEKDGRRWEIPRGAISKARLEVEI
jgi:ribosome maturation factor RimP